MDVIARMEFELTYFDLVVQYFIHYATGIFPTFILFPLKRKFNTFYYFIFISVVSITVRKKMPRKIMNANQNLKLILKLNSKNIGRIIS